MAGDPLLAVDPSELIVSVFVESNGYLVFLQPPCSGPTTLSELEAAEVENERAKARQAEAVERFRERQQQTTMSYTEIAVGVQPDPFLTLRASCETTEAFSGKIERGQFGLKVTIPRVLTPDITIDTTATERNRREAPGRPHGPRDGDAREVARRREAACPPGRGARAAPEDPDGTATVDEARWAGVPRRCPDH
jgi:hypothetical protein